MAVQNDTNTSTGYSKEKKQCDAYLNIDIVDGDGVEHRFQAFNPLYSDGAGRLNRSLVNKAKASKDGTVVVSGKLTVRLANKDDGSDISF